MTCSPPLRRSTCYLFVMNQTHTVIAVSPTTPAPLRVLRDGNTRCFVVTVAEKAWAQSPDESADNFYTRLVDEFARYELGAALPELATHRAWMLADDNYVDPILYESGFFRDKAHHDDVMSRALANFERQRQAKP